MFFPRDFRTAPNQLKIGDDRELINTFFFTGVIFSILSFSAILELIPEPTSFWARRGPGVKKAENPGKRSVSTCEERGCPGVTAWQGSGSCATAEVAGDTLGAKSRDGSSLSRGFPLFYPLVFLAEGGKTAENARTQGKPPPSQFLSARAVQWW